MAKRILIADDSVTIQKAFAMTFAGADDVTVSGARSADEGLALAQRTHPDLVIADGVMPGRSGYDLCASIKADPALRAVPVLILASSQQPYDDARGQKAGADGQLTKPWETNAMMDKVRDLLGRGAGAPAGAAHAPACLPPPPAAPGHRSAASLPTAAIDDDEYGEISIDTGRDSIPTIPRAPAAPPPAPSAGPHQQPIHAGRADSRRTGTPRHRVATAPGVHDVAGDASVADSGDAAGGDAAGSSGHRARSADRGRAAPRDRPAAARGAAGRPHADGRAGREHPDSGRHAPEHAEHAEHAIARRTRSRRPRRRPGSRPDRRCRWTRARASRRRRRAIVSRTPPPAPPQRQRINSPAAQATISASVEQKLAAISAKGPEYEAIAKLSREIIEQVVWEVVPELAEAIIREHVKNKGI